MSPCHGLGTVSPREDFFLKYPGGELPACLAAAYHALKTCQFHAVSA